MEIKLFLVSVALDSVFLCGEFGWTAFVDISA